MPFNLAGRKTSKMPTTTIVSVGYERRSVDELVGILIQYHVQKLLDIREAPVSRRREFGKNALALRLREAGIQYRHLRPAGNPHRHEKNDIQLCLQLYAAYLWQNPEVVDLVADEFSDGPVAVLCYEREQGSCHRSVLFDVMHQRGQYLEIIRVE